MSKPSLCFTAHCKIFKTIKSFAAAAASCLQKICFFSECYLQLASFTRLANSILCVIFIAYLQQMHCFATLKFFLKAFVCTVFVFNGFAFILSSSSQYTHWIYTNGMQSLVLGAVFSVLLFSLCVFSYITQPIEIITYLMPTMTMTKKKMGLNGFTRISPR